MVWGCKFLVGLVAWVKKSKIQQNYFKKLFHMGEEVSLREREVLPTSHVRQGNPAPPRASNTHSPTCKKNFVLPIFPDEGHFYRNLKATVPCQSLKSTTDNSTWRTQQKLKVMSAYKIHCKVCRSIVQSCQSSCLSFWVKKYGSEYYGSVFQYLFWNIRLMEHEKD